MDKIKERLWYHLEYMLDKIDNDWFFIVANGSMNYGLYNDEKSDVDSLLVVVPTADNLIHNHCVNYETKIDDCGEKCKVKDVREFFNMLRKCNINFVEALYSDYFIINPKYYVYWKTLKDSRDAISHYDMWHTVSSCIGMSKNIRAKFGSQSIRKQFSNVVRMRLFIKHFINLDNYKDCIEPVDDEHKLLMEIKYGDKKLKSDKVLDAINLNIAVMESYRDNFERKLKLADGQVKDNQKIVDDILNDVSCRMIKKVLDENES